VRPCPSGPDLATRSTCAGITRAAAPVRVDPAPAGADPLAPVPQVALALARSWCSGRRRRAGRGNKNDKPRPSGRWWGRPIRAGPPARYTAHAQTPTPSARAGQRATPHPPRA